MNRIDKYILSSFIGPFVLTFFIALFVLLMQFLWKYIDDLVGKGLEWYIVTELLFYASAYLVQLALPLAVLLASLMTFGNLGERLELTGFKAAGISMVRFMLGTIVFGVALTIGAFLFSNYVMPQATLKYLLMLKDIVEQKPALNIKENIFYYDIDQYSIHVEDKASDNQHINGVTVYDLSNDRGADNVTIADSGYMRKSDDDRYLLMTFYQGKQYQELKPQSANKKEREHMRMVFDKWEKPFDLSGFEMSRTKEELYKNHHRMLTISQINASVDSLSVKIGDRHTAVASTVKSYFHFKRDSTFVLHPDTVKAAPRDDSYLNHMTFDKRQLSTKRALTVARQISRNTENAIASIGHIRENIAKHEVEKQRKYVLSVACLVFLFIGAPLGAIIRIGGFGAPTFISIIMFMIFFVMITIGEKSAEKLALSPFMGMWLPIFVIFPVGIFLTYKAMNDSVVMSKEWYYKVFNKLLKRNRRKEEAEALTVLKNEAEKAIHRD